MKRKIRAGTTSFMDRIFVRDTSVTGKVAGLTGLTSGSAGLTLYYCRAGDTSATAVTLAAGTLGTWSSGGFREVDAAHMPGWYEVGIPDAAVAAGAASVGLHFRGAANMEEIPLQIELDAVNYQDATRFGLGNLDAAVSTRYAGPSQPINFTGTGTGALVKVDVIDVAGTAASPATPPPTVVQIRQEMDSNSTKLANLDAAVSSRLATSGYAAPPSAATVAAAAWDLATSGHTTAGTFGAAAVAAASAGDPWSTSLPGSYASGTAGNILGNRLDVAVSTRSTYAGGDTAGTTTLLSRIPGTIPANGSSFTALGDARLANLDAAVTTRLATSAYTAPDNADILLIKAKTDNLPASPADESLVIAATTAIYNRIGAAGAGLTALGDARLANLDAAVSTRSTYAGGAVASVTGNVGGNVAGSVASVTAGVTVTTNNDKTGYALSAAGLDVVKGWGTMSARQTLQAVAAFLFGRRSGVPAAGSGGTVVYQDNASVAYGTVTVDTAGDITASSLTPPA